jgi:hypothetical protein
MLHATAGSPWWVSGALLLVLTLHIAAGSMGIGSGFTALLARKGGRLHRRAGTIFFVSMLVMSGIGAAMAARRPDRISTVAGLLTFYLVATAWATVRRGESRIGRFETVAFVCASGIAIAAATIGAIGASNVSGRIDGLPYQPAIGFAIVAAIAAFSDFRMIRRGGIAGAPRIARHLWRMCVALLVAALSFFLGQQKVMPAFMRGSPLLFIPEITVLGLMIFWLFRVRMSARYKNCRVIA